MRIESHRELLGSARGVITRLEAKPELLALLAVNPVLAFKAAGVELSPAMADHVLRTFRLPPQVRAERDELEATLTDALGEAPRPLSPEWLAHVLFEKLRLSPLDVTGQTPVYRPALDAQTVARLATLLPSAGKGRPVAAGGAVATAIRLVEPVTANRLDLDAPVSQLPPASGRPTKVSLEEAWFYKDANPLVRDVLRLALIERTAIPVASAARFRQVRKGEVSHPLTAWISGASFPTVTHQ